MGQSAETALAYIPSRSTAVVAVSQRGPGNRHKAAEQPDSHQMTVSDSAGLLRGNPTDPDPLS